MIYSVLPPVFAVYRKETTTFSLYEPEIILNSVIHRIVPWYRPIKSCWRVCAINKRKTLIPWFEGKRWYIVKNTECKKEIHDVMIQKKPYIAWSLGHSLVWAKSVFEINERCPHIPIIEFNSQKLVSSFQPGFQIVWNMVRSDDLLEESSLGWELVFDRINIYSGAEKPLRIVTPKLKDSDKNKDTVILPVESNSWGATLCSWAGYTIQTVALVTVVGIYVNIVRGFIGI